MAKRLTFRVDNIPNSDTKELEHIIKSFAEQDPDLQRAVATMTCHRLTPRDKHFACATISITTLLSGEDLCARLGRSSKGSQYIFTCRFDGITPLYEDENGADVDIIAIPGLGSHALGSWKSTDSDEVWLRDFLPNDLPNIRVLLYGYDTTLPGSLSKQSIEDLGGTLLVHITAFRANDGTSKRPIVLIGHSLGGLLIKELLIRARRRRSTTESDLSQACYGLLFFGVPNLGLRNEQLRTLVQGQPNKALIDDLLVDNDSEPSTFLKRLADQFSDSCKDYYHVVTFFERTLSPTLELTQDGKWSKTGHPYLLVSEKSATSTGLVAVIDEDNIALNTDHSGLVKYSSRSQGDYPIVRERIRRIVSEAKAEVAKRFSEHYLYLPLSDTVQACLKSLAFDEIESRQFEVEDATIGTCKWLLSNETLIYWTRQHRGLLWIRGKPGSGKSTLMKYALREIPAIYDANTMVISFFFHGRGQELQKTPYGLYRSLIHQLLRCVPGALTDLIDYFENQRKTIGEPGDKWKWELQQLQAFLKSSLIRILKTRSVLLFIDALDECGEELAIELIGHFHYLISSLPSTNARLGIMFSCREYPILDLRKGSTIVLHKENKADIAAFVRKRFSTSDIDAEIQEGICNRAQGVFLWAHFVIERLLYMERNAEPKGKMKAVVERIPQGLHELYRQLIQGMKDRPEALKLIQWICFSTRPLTTVELQWSMVVDPSYAYETLDECEQSDDFITDDYINRRLKILTCGLTEIVPSRNAPVVQFIHQSVKDFFIKHGLLILDSTMKFDMVGPAAHYRLSRCCIHYLKMAMICRSNISGWYNKSDFPFLHYATTSWVSHVKEGVKSEGDSNDLIKYLDWPRESLIWQWVELYREFDLYSDSTPTRGSNLLHIIARYGLTKLLNSVLLHKDNVKVDIDTKDREDGRTPLSWAASGGHNAVVKMLLDTGRVDVDSKDTNGRTPLSWAARDGHVAVVKMFLDTGRVDVDSKDTNGRTPLSWAASGGHNAVVKMLLDTGRVDVDSKDTNGRTPLSWAARDGHVAVVKMFLDTGRVDVDSKDTNGRTPLSWAASGGHVAVVKMLLDTGRVDVDSKDKNGRTPLSWAVLGGRVDVDAKDTNGRTPLSWAAEGGHDAVVKTLLDTGRVDIDSKDSEYGQTPLSWAAEGGHDAVVRMLLDNGRADVDSRSANNSTPLSLAAQGGHDAVVKMLLETGKADVDAKDTKYGRTPLSWAAESGHDAVVEMLPGIGPTFG
ncbi:hypothetical protein N7495_007762 [Penicillium taxi]|uniref:uncharacterized protein n=1 Tax=Penicillium taxi TaxID=168475 RepID=UPI002544F4D8|nr:uncharacterized protein N7495_007762 [Penicillium taxi]KAJ5887721.1 hypothetical protein N7495_007762 [Penicillium taxi]